MGKEKFNFPKHTYHRVNKADEENRVHQIGNHLRSFGNRSGYNATQSTGKCELEEPGLEVDVIALEKKALIPNKGLAATLFVTSVRKRVPRGPECETTATTIEKIPENDIFHVLGSNASSTKHGKACLHKVDQSSLPMSLANH